MNAALSFFQDALGITAPILLVALGGLFTEASGVLNIALEGFMLMGAFAAVLPGSANPFFIFGLAALLSGLLAAILATATFRFKADPFIAALAVNLFSVGIIAVVSEHVFGTKGVIALDFAPGRLFLSQTPTFFFLVFVSFLLIVVFKKSVFGLRIRAAGGSVEAVQESGLSVNRIRFAAFIVSGIAAAIAGAELTIRLGAWVPNISAGRGWIALVAIYLGRKTAGGTLGAALLIGFAFSCANAIQAFTAFPTELSLAIPYAIAALVALTASRKKPFFPRPVSLKP